MDSVKIQTGIYAIFVLEKLRTMGNQVDDETLTIVKSRCAQLLKDSLPQTSEETKDESEEN